VEFLLTIVIILIILINFKIQKPTVSIVMEITKIKKIACQQSSKIRGWHIIKNNKFKFKRSFCRLNATEF